MSVRNPVIAVSIIALVAGAACSRPAAPTTPTAGIPTAPAPTEPTEDPTDPYGEYAIPDDPADIDEAYVERVLVALAATVRDAVADVVRRGSRSASAEQLIRSSHRAASLRAALRGLDAVAASDDFKVNPGRIDVVVHQVLAATPTCIFAFVTQDTSGLVSTEIEPFPGYYHLALKDWDDDPDALNPTPWVIVADEEPREDGREFANPCA